MTISTPLPLHLAAASGNLNEVELLLDAKADCSATDKLGLTAANYALFHWGNLENTNSGFKEELKKRYLKIYQMCITNGDTLTFIEIKQRLQNAFGGEKIK